MTPQRVRLRDHFGLPECLRDWGLPVRSALRSQWTEVEGLRVHSRSAVHGQAQGRDASPFVLIHGLVISSLYFIPLAEVLARRGPVHALDLPGYGRSEKPAKPLDVPALADFVARWVYTMGCAQCHIVGNSFGCQVAAELAARYDGLVETVTLISPTVDPSAPSLLLQALRLLRDMPQEPFRLWANHLVDDCRAGPRFALALIRAMMENHIEANLPRIAMPALVIRGERDPIAPEPWARQAVHLLPDGRLVTVPHGSHCVHYAAPEPTAAAIFAFLDQVRATRQEQLRAREYAC